MVPFAVTLSDLIEKGGAYAGIAAFFGLAVLAVLFFAQARELKRLREWAGRAPERAQELEQRVVEQAEAARRVRAEPQAQPFRRPGEPATAAAQQAAAAPAAGVAAPVESEAVAAETPPAEAGTAEPPVVPTAAAPDAAEAEPEESAGAEAAGTEEPAREEAAGTEEPAGEEAAGTEEPAGEEAAGTEEPAQDPSEDAAEAEPDAVPAGAAAVPATVAAGSGTAPPPTPATPGGPTLPGNGMPAAGEIPALPARATPVPPPRRTAPALPSPAAALRSDTSATRRPLPRRPVQPEPEPESSARRTGLIVAGALAGVALIVTAILSFGGGGGGREDTSQRTTTTPSPSATITSSGGPRETRRPGVPTRSETTVAVLNGTTIAGLAGSVNTRLQQGGFQQGPTPTNYTDQARSATVVFYASSVYRTRASEAAKLLSVSDVQPIIDAARQLAPGADVVVVVGADQSP